MSSQFPPPPPSVKSNVEAKGWVVASVVLLLLGLAIYVWLHRAHVLCDSGLGQLAQAFSSKAVKDCGLVDLIYPVSAVSFVASAVCAVLAAVRWKRL